METFVRSHDGIDLWTCAEGDGRPVVFLPGGPGCCDYLEPVAHLLGPGFRAIRYDPRGCGRSGHCAVYTVADSIADLEDIRQHYGLDRWAVVGHSWGADLALHYALAHPGRVERIVCLSGGRFFTDREWHEAYHRRRDAGEEPDLAYAFPPNLEVNRQLSAGNRAHIRRPALLRELASLSIPALFVYGSEDIRPGWPVEQVAALLPDARFVTVEGAAHNLWLTHATALAHELATFFSQ